MQTAVLLVLLGGCVCSVQSGDESQNLQTRVENLERSLLQLQNPPRVAFTAGLNPNNEQGNYGPYNIDTTILFKRVLTNVGNNYNFAKGIFTAPVKGLHFFYFSLMATFDPAPNMRAALKRNTEFVAYVFDEAPSDTHDSVSRADTLVLEVGDMVYVELERGKSIYGLRGQNNMFSGFLLHPL
ncbi:complement C1q-like protein 4 [Eucyclogobius newberryi]|uniref:complement C1q-like protein 4 n=1 Tax=Eucyclogobius newberryi TaxID=166745 RepID=UPI003B59F000